MMDTGAREGDGKCGKEPERYASVVAFEAKAAPGRCSYRNVHPPCDWGGL